MQTEQLVIFGSGPAGLTAALYAARAQLSPLVVEGGFVRPGDQPGGQLMSTTIVENYPGFPEGVDGPELMRKMRAQAERFGARFVPGAVTSIDLSKKRPFSFRVEQQTYQSRSLIIATGARAKLLGVPGEQEFMGKGISTCATCDGYFFKDQPVAVVGGGDAALEEALFLSRLATKVVVVYRGSNLRASQIMQQRAKQTPNIRFAWNSELVEIVGKDFMTAAKVRNSETGETADLPVKGVFIAIGHLPNTGLVEGQLELDANRYVVLRSGSQTSVEGVFAAGDVADPAYRQAVTAAGMGSIAAIDAERWLQHQT